MSWQVWIEAYVGFSSVAVAVACHVLLQSTILLGIGILAERLLRRRGAATQSAVYRMTLVAVLLCPPICLLFVATGVNGVALPWSRAFDSRPATPSAALLAAPDADLPPRLVPVSRGDTSHSAAAPAAAVEPDQSTSAPTLSNEPDTPAQPSASFSVSALLACLLASAWVLGSVLLLVRQAAGYMHAAFLCRKACEAPADVVAACRSLAQRLGVAPPQVRVTPFAASPCLVGLWRPLILLPEMDADEATVRDLLLHELAHLVRRDLAWKLLGDLSTAVLFFQPLLWWLARPLARSAEEVCDDYVMHFGGDPGAYARRLVDVAQRYQPLPAALNMVSLKSLLGQRVLRILDPSRRLCLAAGLRALVAISMTAVAAALLVGLVGAAGNSTRAAAGPPSAEAKAAGPEAEPSDPSTMLVEGRVVDATGKPISGAAVVVLQNTIGIDGYFLPAEVGYQGTTDPDGRFRYRAPRALSTAAKAVAIAPGYGVGGCDLKMDRPQSSVEIKLWPERPIRGRLVDLQGAPAANVQVRFKTAWHHGPREPFVVHYDSPAPLAALPPPAVSDAQGRFLLHGITLGPSDRVIVTAEIDDERFARQQLQFEAKKTESSDEKVFPLLPPQWIEGTLVGQDTGQPLAGAVLSIGAKNDRLNPSQSSATVSTKTDAQGRFRAQAYAGKWFEIFVYPAAGTPYPAWRHQFPWPQAAVRHEIKIELPRGVLIRGLVREAGSGKAVAGAAIRYVARRENNPHYSRDAALGAARHSVLSDADGRFELAVMPGPGHLMLKAPTPDYLHTEVGWNMLENDKPGGNRQYPDAFVNFDLKPGDPPQEVALKVRRGVTVRGTVVGPDDKPIQEAVLISSTYVPPRFIPEDGRLQITGGRFELPGCDPEKPLKVFFLDVKHQWGATLTIDPKRAAAQEPAVRLRPCGSATVRLLDEKKQPYADRQPYVSGNRVTALIGLYMKLVVIPGTSRTLMSNEEHFEGIIMNQVDPDRYRDVKTDATGRMTFPTLIPDAPYAIVDGFHVKDEFRAKSGENVQLPDLVLTKP